jgi:general stress protein 26
VKYLIKYLGTAFLAFMVYRILNQQNTRIMKNKTLKEIKESVKDKRIGSFCTVTANNAPSARPMTLQEWNSENNLWFFTSKKTDIATDLVSNTQVSISFNKDKSEYFSLSGNAYLVDNQAEIDKRWSMFVKAWFPEGKDSNDIVLIKVDLDAISYWGDDSSIFHKGYHFAKALLNDETYSGGVSETIVV